MRTRLNITAVAGIMLMNLLASSVTFGDAHSYTSARRQIKVGVLTSSALKVPVPSGTSNENPDPHLFYIAEKRADLKPIGLEFINPIAPPVLTGPIYQRWLNRVRTGAGVSDPAFVPGTPQAQLFQVGAKVTKNMGAYWEVNLDDVSGDQLKQFDLLFLHSHKTQAAFPSDQREKLRKFVDGGGTLYVENCGRFQFDNNAPFLFDINMHTGFNASSGAVVATPNHPLLSYPYIISSQEAQTIGDKYVNDFYLYQPDPTNPGDFGPGPNAINPPATGSLQPIIWNTRGFSAANVITPGADWRPYIMAGVQGAGRIVYSSCDSGCALNDYVGGQNAGYGGNSAAISGEFFSGAHPVDLKFMYNMVLWTGAHLGPNTDARRTGNTLERSGGALVEKWAGLPVAGTARVGGPAFSKHCVFSVDGNLVMHCYDTKPGEDLDGDGNTDDGKTDFITGTATDEIWSFDLTTAPGAGGATGASTPTIVEFYDPNYPAAAGFPNLVNFPNREQVVVVLSNGTVVALRAFPRASSPGFPFYNQTLYGTANGTVIEWSISTLGTDYGINSSRYIGVPSAAYSDGMVYVPINTSADGGRIAVVDPHDGSSAFHPGVALSTGTGNGLVPDVVGVPSFIGSPTIGYVRDHASGANDKILYIQTAVPSGGVSLPESVRGFPIGTKAEPLRRLGNTPVFESRSTGTRVNSWYIYDPATPSNNYTLRQRVFVTYKNPISGLTANMELTYDPTIASSNSYKVDQLPGQPVHVTMVPAVQFPNGGPNVPSNDDNLTFYADYFLDWFVTGAMAPKVNSRATYMAPDPNRSGTTIGGSPSISTDDLLYYTVDTTNTRIGYSDFPGTGLLYSVQDQGNNANSLTKWVYQMHDGFNAQLDNGTVVTIPPRLRQTDTDTAILTGVPGGSYLWNVQFQGTPAIRGDVIYAVATAFLGVNRPAAGVAPNISVVCAFKANPEMVLQLGPGVNPNGLQISQFNPGLSQNGQGGKPGKVVIQPNTQYTFDPVSGTVRFISASPPGPAALPATPFISASLPFVVKANGGNEAVIFGTKNDVFENPIGTVQTETRMVAPSTIDNLLWYAVIPSNATQVFSNIGVASTSPSIQNDILWLGFSNGSVLSMDADPAATDPTAQVAGAQIQMVKRDGSYVHLRWLKKSTVALSPILGAPVATTNLLAVNSIEGVRGYEDTYTMIAEGNRLIEVNAAGDAVWTCDGTRAYGTAGGDLPQYIVDPGSGNVIPVNPTSATGVAVVQNVHWSRPTVARRIGVSDLLVVDTGNNRVVQVDRGGNVVWEVVRMFDNFKTLLRQGDPLTLNEPSDAQTWTEVIPSINAWFSSQGLPYTYSNAAGYVIHYLIADTGNFRIVEMIDVYDAAGRVVTPNIGGNPAGFAMLRQLYFTTSTYGVDGKKYRYGPLQRVLVANGALPPTWQDPSKAAGALIRLTLALISNYRTVGDPTIVQNAVGALGQTMESGGGSIVVLSEAGKPLSTVSTMRIPNGAGGFTIQDIDNPTWFSKFDEVDPMSGLIVFKYLLADSNGCYQLRPGVDPMTGLPDPRYMDVEWLMTNQDYYRMTGKKLIAQSIRRLNSVVTVGPNAGRIHHFLIANRAAGSDNPSNFGITYNNTGNPANGNIAGPTEFRGEVFEIDPTTFAYAAPFHGYTPDYFAFGNFLVPMDGKTHTVGATTFGPLAQASIAWRSSSEQAPATPIGAFIGEVGTFRRFVGSKDRATSTAILESPFFADRQF